MSDLFSEGVDLEGREPLDAPTRQPLSVLEDVDLVEVGIRFVASALILLHQCLVLRSDLLAMAALIVLEVKNERLASSFLKQLIQSRCALRHGFDRGIVHLDLWLLGLGCRLGLGLGLLNHRRLVDLFLDV